MPTRSYVEIVTPNTCLGDSLVTFNTNFSALDDRLTKQPTLFGGPGINVQPHYTEQGYNTTVVASKNSFVYSDKFDYTNGAEKNTITFRDGIPISVVSFPHDPQSYNLATFTAASLTDIPPVVTLYWTASGSNLDTTVYATNSATSATNDLGSLSFNGAITALYKSGNYIYVGGEFTSVGNYPYKKFCVLDLESGSTIGNLQKTGTLPNTSIHRALSSEGGFGSTGAVNVILEHENFLIFGGSYQSLKMGRGLSIYYKNNETIYPFYVNGEVNSLAIRGTYLYVGGKFDYINYTSQSASVASGLRVLANGLIKINLALIIDFPNSSIEAEFSNNIQKAFTDSVTINSILNVSNILFIGGAFQAQVQSNTIASNLAILNPDGTIDRNWNPVIGGPVHKIAQDGNYLYVGGDFNYVSTALEFLGSPRTMQEVYNIACYNITAPAVPVLETVWKPKFNGSVTNITFHDTEYGSYVYCIGNFTAVNDVAANYVAAVTKSYSNQYAGEYVPWRVNVDKPFKRSNQSLLRLNDSVLIGGEFQYVNGLTRINLIRVNGAYEQIPTTEELKSVNWSLGGQSCNPGANLSLNLTNTVTVTSQAARYGVVNQTIFSRDFTTSLFKNSTQGSLLRLFIQRPNASHLSQNLNSQAHVLGWKLDFN